MRPLWTERALNPILGRPTFPTYPPVSNQLPTQEFLRKELNYDPETGILTWAYGRKGVMKGKVAGYRDKTRVGIRLNRRIYSAHRIIWKWMTGEDPPQYVDHINHNPHDNRWENLRLATPTQNNANMRSPATKYKRGVAKTTKGTRFQAQISVEGRTHYLGMFKTEDEAHQAYCEAADRIHGLFACYESKPKVSTEKTS